jgi:hypothetical protein
VSRLTSVGGSHSGGGHAGGLVGLPRRLGHNDGDPSRRNRATSRRSTGATSVAAAPRLGMRGETDAEAIAFVLPASFSWRAPRRRSARPATGVSAARPGRSHNSSRARPTGLEIGEYPEYRGWGITGTASPALV